MWLTSSIERHSSSPHQIMVLETFPVHELLREDIASAKQNLALYQDSLTSIVLPKKLTADIKACVRTGRAATFA